MHVGIPTETKNNEFRVAVTPSGVAELTRRGHEVVIQAGAGEGSAIADSDFKAAGAQLVATADEAWAEADLVLKVRSRNLSSTAECGAGKPCSPTCTWPPPGPAPTRCWHRPPHRSPTRPCRPPTARCPSWRP